MFPSSTISGPRASVASKKSWLFDSHSVANRRPGFVRKKSPGLSHRSAHAWGMLGMRAARAPGKQSWSLSSQTFSSHHTNGGRVKPNGGGKGGVGGGGGRRGAGVAHVHMLKAPNNTSSFLIDDLQERETSEQKKPSITSSTHPATADNPAPPHHRPRSYSSLASVSPVDAMEQLDAESVEEEDSEFTAEFENASMERIENLSRDEVNREMLNVERVNRRLYDCVDTLKSENGRLKNLLERHGITTPAFPPAGCGVHPLGSLSKSRSSSTEEGGTGTSGENVREEEKDSERRTLSD